MGPGGAALDLSSSSSSQPNLRLNHLAANHGCANFSIRAQCQQVGIGDLSLFAYPGSKDLVMATFVQDYRSSNLSNKTVKRQYWVREGGAWRILHESVLS